MYAKFCGAKTITVRTKTKLCVVSININRQNYKKMKLKLGQICDEYLFQLNVEHIKLLISKL